MKCLVMILKKNILLKYHVSMGYYYLVAILTSVNIIISYHD